QDAVAILGPGLTCLTHCSSLQYLAPRLSGTMVTQAILDEQGRLILERTTMRKAGEPRPENRIRVLTVLNGETLETVREAIPPADTGGLVGVSRSDFVFLEIGRAHV